METPFWYIEIFEWDYSEVFTTVSCYSNVDYVYTCQISYVYDMYEYVQLLNADVCHLLYAINVFFFKYWSRNDLGQVIWPIEIKGNPFRDDLRYKVCN